MTAILPDFRDSELVQGLASRADVRRTLRAIPPTEAAWSYITLHSWGYAALRMMQLCVSTAFSTCPRDLPPCRNIDTRLGRRTDPLLFDTELAHPILQRGALQPQPSRGAILSANHSTAIRQHFDDVVPLRIR